MTSLAELRNRLKSAASKKSDLIPYRTCIDIVIKMQRDGLFGEDVIFTTDGLDLLTVSVLDAEIADTVNANGGRMRMSALSRDLALAEDTVTNRCKAIPGLVVYLNDVIAASWFADAAEEIRTSLQHKGELKLTQIAERLLISLELVSSRIVPLLRDVEPTKNGVFSHVYLSIIKARIRGLVRALSAPKPVEWIADQVACPNLATASTILIDLPEFGAIKEGVFTPLSWTEKEVETALSSWREKSWCSLSSLRLKIGSGKPQLTQWLESQGLQESNNCLVTVSSVVRLDNDLVLPVVKGATAVRLWIDVKTVLQDRLNSPDDVDYSAIAKMIRNLIPNLARWTLGGSAIFSDRFVPFLIDDALPASNLREMVIENLSELYGITAKSFGAYKQLIAQLDERIAEIEEKRRPKTHDELENQIVKLYWSIVTDCASILKWGNNDVFLQSVQNTSILDLVQLVFEMVAVRFCHAHNVAVSTPEERDIVIKAVSVASIAEALKELEALLLLSPASIPEFVASDGLKRLLCDVTVVVSKPDKRNRASLTHVLSECISELESARDSQTRTFWALHALVTKTVGSRIGFLQPENVSTLLPHLHLVLQDQVPEDILDRLESPEDGRELVQAISQFIWN